MKCLYLPFFSQQDKDTFKFKLECDENIRIAQMVIQSLVKVGFEVTLVLPSITTGNDYFTLPVVHLVEYRDFYPDNIMQRYDFNIGMYVDLFRERKYDLIINNSPELTKNVYAAYYYVWKSFPKMITITHFVDHPHLKKLPFKISYFPRQVESAQVSDLSVFLSDQLRESFLVSSGLESQEKIKTWYMSFDSEEIDALLDPVEKFKVKTIVFPNRISSTNYTNHIAFIDAVNDLWKRRKDFDVIFTNTTSYYSEEELSKMVPNAKFVDTVSRKNYLNTLKRCHVAVALFLTEIHGGLSIREAVYCGCIPVVPRIHDYKMILPSYAGGFVSPDLNDLSAVLEWALYEAEYSSEYKEAVKREDYRNSVVKIENDIRSIL